MSDLRAGLEQLADDMAYDVAGAPARIRAVLAKHPVEPAPEWEIPRENRNTQWDDLRIEHEVERDAEPAGVSDEAVEAAAQSLYDQAMNYQALHWDGSARAVAPTAQEMDVHESVKDRYRSRARSVLAAALPHLQPQPVASREDVEQALGAIGGMAGLHGSEHSYDRTCPLCKADIPRIVDALVAAGVAS